MQYKINGTHTYLWKNIDHVNDNDISISIKIKELNYNNIIGMNLYRIKLTIQSIRRLNAGNYVDHENTNRIFIPNTIYELLLNFIAINSSYVININSESLIIRTNKLPSGGLCIIQDISNIQPLDYYNLSP